MGIADDFEKNRSSVQYHLISKKWKKGGVLNVKTLILIGGVHKDMYPLSLCAPVGMSELFGKPVLEHMLVLLRAGGFREVVMVLGAGEQQVRDYFGDGTELGMSLRYSMQEGSWDTQSDPAWRQDEPVLVLSGDLLWNFDLGRMVQCHRERGGQATILLGQGTGGAQEWLTVTDEAGRVLSLTPSAGQGQRMTDQVSVGMAVLDPAALNGMPLRSGFENLVLQLLARCGTVYGQNAEGHWRRIRDNKDYLACVEDALRGAVKLEMGAPQQSAGVWSERPVPEGVTVIPPCWLGEGAVLERGSTVGPCVMLGRETRAERGSVVQRSVLLPGARVEELGTLYGAVLDRNAVAQRGAVLNMGTVLGARAVAGRRSVLLPGVKVWPGRAAPAGCRLSRSITEGEGYGVLRFGDNGVISGVLGEDMAPEGLVTIGSALGWEGKVGLGAFGGRGAHMLAQAAASAITASGAVVLHHDLECAAQGAWLAQRYQLPVSLFVEQSGERVFLHLFDRDGLPLSSARQGKIERRMMRGDFLRVQGGEIGRQEHAQVGRSEYIADAVRRGRLGRMGLRTLGVAVPGDSPAESTLRQCLTALGCRVTDRWEKGIPAFGLERGGFCLTAQDERGTLLEPEQLLPLVCLIEMEQGEGRLAVPEGVSAAVDLVAAGFGRDVLRLGRDGGQARSMYARMPWMWDGVFAAVRICSRMTLSGQSLEELMNKTPRFTTRKREVLLLCERGKVMGELARSCHRRLEGEHLRIREGNGWVCLQPLARRRALRVVAESADMEMAGELCDFYAKRIARVDRALHRQDAQGSVEN